MGLHGLLKLRIGHGVDLVSHEEPAAVYPDLVADVSGYVLVVSGEDLDGDPVIRHVLDGGLGGGLDRVGEHDETVEDQVALVCGGDPGPVGHELVGDGEDTHPLGAVPLHEPHDVVDGDLVEDLDVPVLVDVSGGYAEYLRNRSFRDHHVHIVVLLDDDGRPPPDEVEGHVRDELVRVKLFLEPFLLGVLVYRPADLVRGRGEVSAVEAGVELDRVARIPVHVVA